MGYDTLQAVFAQKVSPDDKQLLPVPQPGEPQDRNGVLLYVGSGGNIVVKPVGNTDEVTFFNVPSGTFIPVRVVKVLDDSGATTAQSIVALW